MTKKETTDSESIYNYEKSSEPVARFTGTHPALMKERILRKSRVYHPDPFLKYASLKDRIKRLVAKWTGWYPGEYKNYKIAELLYIDFMVKIYSLTIIGIGYKPVAVSEPKLPSALATFRYSSCHFYRIF